jgi:hypothetical protein
VSRVENLLPEPLPLTAGYATLLGVPMDVVEQLRSLHQQALDGGLSLRSWRAGHAEALAGHGPDVGAAELQRLTAAVDAAAVAAVDDFDHWMFLAGLLKDLRLLRTPDPARELQELEAAMPALTDRRSRLQAERELRTLRVLAGRTPPEPYEPGARMLKALRVGTLEETNRWLQAAVTANPGASVQDLLTWAAVEVAEAKLELDRYDALKDRPNDSPA